MATTSASSVPATRGAFSTLPLANGSSLFRTNTSNSFIGVAFDGSFNGIVCWPASICSPGQTTGTLVVIAAGTASPHVDFNEPPAGFISGTVRELAGRS